MKRIKKWRHRFRTKVRYRLLMLTSIPIILTLAVLLVFTLYWSFTQGWTRALFDVKSNVSVVNQRLDFLQERQALQLRKMADSHAFYVQVHKVSDEAKNTKFSKKSARWTQDNRTWARSNAKKYGLDYLVIYPASQIERFPDELRHFLLKEKGGTFFDVFSNETLLAFSPALAQRAKIEGLNVNKGLMSRSLLPVFNEDGQLTWILDGAILINNNPHFIDELQAPLLFDDPSLALSALRFLLGDFLVNSNLPDNLHQSVNSNQARILLRTPAFSIRYEKGYLFAQRPLFDVKKETIGQLQTGFLAWPLVQNDVINIAGLVFGALFTLFISSLIVYRGAKNLFRPIERIHRVVRLIRIDQDARIGNLGRDPEHELVTLAREFDHMLDRSQEQNEAILQNALELEDKVKERTLSLQEKTIQLEQNIHLLELTRNKLFINEKLAALGELTAGIAHEINNPTAVILGNIELMQSGLGEHVHLVQEEIDAVLEQIERIRNITRSLLQYSRQGGVQDQVTWQHVNPVIEESVILVRSGMKKKQMKIITELNAKCIVEINRHQLLQVLVNLQMNGSHAMNEKGNLIVRSDDWLDETGNVTGVKISVEDFGCGISKENLNKIFDPFFTTRRFGSGLGLSVTQGIVRGLGGDIQVDSTLGKGSTFCLYIRKKLQSDPTTALKWMD